MNCQATYLIAAICCLALPGCSNKEELPPDVPERWQGLITRLVAGEDLHMREQSRASTAVNYSDLRKKAVDAASNDDLDGLHIIGTQLNIMAAMEGRTEAYSSAITVFRECLRKNSTFAPAKWGLAFTYYNILISSCRPVQAPSGLFTYQLDEHEADMMLEVYRLSYAAVKGGYGPSDPNVLEMSYSKLRAYCQNAASKPAWYGEICSQ